MRPLACRCCCPFIRCFFSFFCLFLDDDGKGSAPRIECPPGTVTLAEVAHLVDDDDDDDV